MDYVSIFKKLPLSELKDSERPPTAWSTSLWLRYVLDHAVGWANIIVPTIKEVRFKAIIFYLMLENKAH